MREWMAVDSNEQNILQFFTRIKLTQFNSRSMVAWRHSEAKRILLGDLESGILSVYDKDVSAEEAWCIYSVFTAFQSVSFEQFKKQLHAHRKQCLKFIERTTEEEAAFQHDRALHPRQTHNNRGEPVFDMLPAKELLRKDVRSGKHLIMTPTELQESRPEYMLFKKRKFKERIYQEVRRNKFIYFLEQKREKQAKKQDKKRQRNLQKEALERQQAIKG